MRRKRILLAALLLPLAVATIQAAEVPAIITISNDGSETKYELATVQKVTFAESGMVVERKNAAAKVENVRCISFSTIATPDIITNNSTLEGTELFVYPNPVAETLRIDGAEAGSTFTIYDLQGRTLLQTTEPQVNVSSLAQGSYLIKIGNQVVKFVKK